MSAAFETCLAADLAGDVHAGEPGAHAFSDVLCIPSAGSSTAMRAALFDRTGHAIVTVAGAHPRTRPLDPASLPRAGRAIYGGVITRDGDRFLPECLATLWYFSKHARPADRVMFLSELSVAEIFDRPWLARLLSASGVRDEMVVVPASACVFDMLVVPDAAIRDDAVVFAEFGAYCRTIARIMSPYVFDKPAYWLSQAGQRPFDGEAALEEHLGRHGVEIVAADRLDIDRRIALFGSGAVVAGMIGPIFQTMAFCETGRAIAFSTSPHIPRGFALRDAVSGGNTSYLHLAGHDMDAQALGEAILAAIAAKAAEPATRQDGAPIVPAARPSFFRAFSIASMPFGPLRIDLVSGHVYAHAAPRSRSSELHLLTHGDYAFLVAADHDRPAITILQDGRPTPVAAYVAEAQADGLVALKSPQSDMYLTIYPDGSPASASAAKAADWEFFRLAEQPELLSMHAELVRGLERALHGANVSSHAVHYAMQRLTERQPAI